MSDHTSLKSYLTDINFLEEPLVGLCEKPLSTMNDTELRAWVQEQRLTRENKATFKARVNAQSNLASEKKDTAPKVDIFGQFS